MIDCPNGMMRDRLPDLLHGRLDAGERAEVAAHVRGCAACKAELALLAELRGVMRAAPAIDVAAIVAALPAPPRGTRTMATRARWADWRAAAAIALMAGGTSFVMLRHAPTEPVAAVGAMTPVSAPVVVTRTGATAGESATAVARPVSPVVAPSPMGAPSASAAMPSSSARPERVAASSRELAVGSANVSDLSDRELSALVASMNSLDATPSLEPDVSPVTPVSPGKGGA